MTLIAQGRLIETRGVKRTREIAIITCMCNVYICGFIHGTSNLICQSFYIVKTKKMKSSHSARKYEKTFRSQHTPSPAALFDHLRSERNKEARNCKIITQTEIYTEGMFNLLQMCFIVNYVTRVSHVIFE